MGRKSQDSEQQGAAGGRAWGGDGLGLAGEGGSQGSGRGGPEAEGDDGTKGVRVGRGGPRSHTREPERGRGAAFWAEGTRSRNGVKEDRRSVIRAHAACRKNEALRWRRFLCVGSQPAYVHTDVLYAVAGLETVLSPGLRRGGYARRVPGVSDIGGDEAAAGRWSSCRSRPSDAHSFAETVVLPSTCSVLRSVLPTRHMAAF